jgi:hypothetical protein
MHTVDATAVQPLLAAITIMGSGRLGPTVSALVAVVGTVIGAFALARARHRTDGDPPVDAARARTLGAAALALGSVSVLLGGVFLAATDGGPGTGNGVVASVAALVLGPVALVLGGVGRRRRRVVGAPAGPANATNRQ